MSLKTLTFAAVIALVAGTVWWTQFEAEPALGVDTIEHDAASAVDVDAAIETELARVPATP